MSSAFNLLKNTFRNIQNGSATAADPCKTQGYSSVGLVAQRSLRIAKNITLSRTYITETLQHALCSSGVKETREKCIGAGTDLKVGFPKSVPRVPKLKIRFPNGVSGGPKY